MFFFLKNQLYFILIHFILSGQLIVSKQPEFEQARDDILGPQDERTPEQVWFEKDPRAKKVHSDGGRCYSLGHLVQQPRSTEAPAATSKIFNEDFDEFLQKRKRLLEVPDSPCL